VTENSGCTSNFLTMVKSNAISILACVYSPKPDYTQWRCLPNGSYQAYLPVLLLATNKSHRPILH